MDLCEDENIQIRRQAIKELPQLCKDNKEHTSKIGDILAQLLIVDDSAELQQVHMSLQSVMKYDAKGTLAGVVSIIFYCASIEVSNAVVLRPKTHYFLLLV